MRVLVVGSGGREHALCWSLAKNKEIKLWCAPGNPGTAQIAINVPIPADDVMSLVKFASANDITMVVPGSEVALCAGITDAMNKADIPCVGPTMQAAQLEGSKAFTKVLCKTSNIPTAEWRAFRDINSAKSYIDRIDMPIVIKADGIAAGKGVIIANNRPHAIDVIKEMIEGRAFGNAGNIVVMEKYLVGEEVSFFVLCNGNRAVPFGVAQDHKRLTASLDSPNTGGMGAYTNPSCFTSEMQSQTMERIIKPTLHAMSKRNRPMRGILFAGLMITDDGPQLIEYNVRLGDPEWQAMSMCLESDLGQIFRGVISGRIPTPKMRPEIGISVVMASPGYPVSPQKGSEIRNIIVTPPAQVFHAGTEITPGGRLIANGGRVLTVCATGASREESRENVYSAISAIDWPEGIYRPDIGA